MSNERNNAMLKNKLRIAIIIVTLFSLVLLYFFPPQDFAFYPRCPFFALTGLKCPGCGSLRAIHKLLHFDFGVAFAYNWCLLPSVLLILVLCLYPKFSRSIVLSKLLVVFIVAYWITRNL